MLTQNKLKMSGINLTQLRKAAGLSQNDLATVMGVHLRTVQRWEMGAAIPDTKRAVLADIAANPAKYMPGAAIIGHTINAPIRLGDEGTEKKLVEALLKSQEQIDRLIAVIERLSPDKSGK